MDAIINAFLGADHRALSVWCSKCGEWAAPGQGCACPAKCIQCGHEARGVVCADRVLCVARQVAQRAKGRVSA